jgi:hypothetical protein
MYNNYYQGNQGYQGNYGNNAGLGGGLNSSPYGRDSGPVNMRSQYGQYPSQQQYPQQNPYQYQPAQNYGQDSGFYGQDYGYQQDRGFYGQQYGQQQPQQMGYPGSYQGNYPRGNNQMRGLGNPMLNQQMYNQPFRAQRMNQNQMYNSYQQPQQQQATPDWMNDMNNSSLQDAPTMAAQGYDILGGTDPEGQAQYFAGVNGY